MLSFIHTMYVARTTLITWTLNTLRCHQCMKGLGISNASRLFDVLDSLKKYFEHLKQYSDPLTMKIVSTSFGMEARVKVETVCLPPHYTKLGIYQDWCLHQGHIIAFVKKSWCKINGPSLQLSQPFDDDEWPEESEQGNVVPFSCFKTFWQANYHELVVRAQGKDTCNKYFEIFDSITHFSHQGAHKEYLQLPL